MARRITREKLSLLSESQTVEFKRSLASRADGMKALNAMVNTDSAEGTVLFGVDDDGTPAGIGGRLRNGFRVWLALQYTSS